MITTPDALSIQGWQQEKAELQDEITRLRKAMEDWHDRAGVAEREADRLRTKIDLLSEVVSELSQALNPHYMMSEHGREYLAKMAKALNA